MMPLRCCTPLGAQDDGGLQAGLKSKRVCWLLILVLSRWQVCRHSTRWSIGYGSQSRRAPKAGQDPDNLHSICSKSCMEVTTFLGSAAVHQVHGRSFLLLFESLTIRVTQHS